MPDIKAIIWDFDGTIYRFDKAFTHACNVAAVKACMEQNDEIKFKEAMHMAENSLAQYNFSGYELFQKYKIDEKLFHQNYHLHINETIINACTHTHELLSNINIDMGIISHASKEWIIRTLNHLGLSEFFKEQNILAFEDYNFAHKARETISYEIMLDRLNANPEHTLMVEDSYANLKGAKKAGLQTMYLHHAKPLTPQPDYIDKQYNNIIELIETEALHSS